MKTPILMKTILLAGACVCAIGPACAGIPKGTSLKSGLLSDSSRAAGIKRTDIKFDGTVRLVSKTYGNVAVKPDDLRPGDVIRNNSGWLEATQQWEERYAAELKLVAKAEAEKREAERIVREAKEAEERAERERIAKEEASKREAERIAREKEIKARKDAFIEEFRAEIEQKTDAINNIHSNLYQSLYAISTNELLRGTKWGEEPIMDVATKLISKWEGSEYVNWTNKTYNSELVFVGMPNAENPWKIGIAPSFLNTAEKKVRDSGNANDYMRQTNQPGRYYEYDNFVEETQKYLVRLEKKAAAEKELEAKAIVASKLIAEMPEAEKFPLLSVQPKPQMLVKGVSSGASVKWVEGWLTANKAEPRGVKEATIRDGMLYYKLTGMGLKDVRQEMIFATFNEQGKPTRNAVFYFNDGVLVGVNIVIEGSTLTVDQLIEKYSSELGGSVKVERGNKKDVREFAYNAKTPDEIDYFNQVRWFVQDCFANVANSDVNVRIDYKVFAGLIALSQDTLAMLNMLGVEEQVRYLEFGKDGKADLIVSADGSVLRCTSEGKTLKGWVAGASELENCKRKVENVSDKVIKVEDKKLKAHFDAIERSKAEAARKAAEEAKKKADAAALDF